MKRKNINILVIITCGLTLYNLLSNKGLTPFFITCTSEYLDFSYDISLALFSGGIIYLLSTAIPNYLSILNIRKIYNKSLNNFIYKSLNNLESIEKIDYSQNEEVYKKLFQNIKYGDRVKVTQGSKNTIHKVLNTIYNEREKIYRDCLPLTIAANDFEKQKQIYSLINHELFRKSRKYIYTEEDELANDTVQIGFYIKKFYDELKKINIK